MLDDWLTAQFGMSGGVSTDCPATGYTVTPTPDRVNGIKHLNYLIRTEKYISQQSLAGIQCIPPQGQSCNTKIMTISTSVQAPGPTTPRLFLSAGQFWEKQKKTER